MRKLLLAAALLLPMAISANENILDTEEATAQALEDFQAMSSQSTVNKFAGFKSWPVSGGVRVKIYVQGENSVDFSCHRHSASEPFECH